MNILEASTAVLKTTTRFAWWGVAVGVFVGLHVAGALAKPLAGEVSRGAAAFNKGFISLREKLKKASQGPGGGKPTAKEKDAPAARSYKIPVEDVATSPSESRPEGQEEPDHPKVAARAGEPKSSRREQPSLKWTKANLVAEAEKLGIIVRPSMSKKDLLEVISARVRE